MAPKQRVKFFDNPPTIGDVHHNQIFKFIDLYSKNGLTNSKVSPRFLSNPIPIRPILASSILKTL
jgi:hypothetical protein